MNNVIMHWVCYLQHRTFSVIIDHQALLYFSKGQRDLTNRHLQKLCSTFKTSTTRYHTGTAKTTLMRTACPDYSDSKTLKAEYLISRGITCDKMTYGLPTTLPRKMYMNRELLDLRHDRELQTYPRQQ